MLTAKSTMPTKPTKPRDIIKSRASEYLSEIQARFGHKSFKPTHLGDGGAGVVYRVGTNKVVKVMLGNTLYKKVQYYKQLFKQLACQTGKAQQGVYEHFYVHSTFHTSRELNRATNTPHFVYELMEYMPSDLKAFSRQDRWTSAEFKSILCQIMHGLHMFHRIGYVITDLKVDNVLINPMTGQIKLNDFCESYNLHTRSSCMYTYRNFGASPRHSTQEDVWRLAMLIIEFLHPRVMHLVKTNRLHPPEKDIRNTRKRLMAKEHYNYQTMIAPYVAYQKHVLLTHDATNKTLWEQLFRCLVRMLDNDPQKRPTIHQLLTSRLFCYTCFTPRADYKHAFGERYSESEHPQLNDTPVDSCRRTSADRKASMHTPDTASSRASLPVPSTTVTGSDVSSSSRRTTSDYGHRRRKRHRRRHVTPTHLKDQHTTTSSYPHRTRTRRARKHRSWTGSSKTGSATSYDNVRLRKTR